MKKKPFYKRIWFWVVTPIGLFILSAMIAAIVDPPTTPEKPAATVEKPADSKTAAENPEVDKPKPVEANPEEVAKKSAEKRFDAKDVEVTFNSQNGHLLIRVPGKDNLKTSLIRTGMLNDIGATLKDLKDVKGIKDVTFNVTFPMKDQNGNSSQDNVMKISLSEATRTKINWDSFISKNLPDIADSYWENPALGA